MRNLRSRAYRIWMAAQKPCRLGCAAGALVLSTVALSADSSATRAVAQYLVAHAVRGGPSLAATAPLTADLESLSVPLPPPPDLALRVTTSRWDALQRQLEFHLECSIAGACRPFLATLRPPDGKVPRELLGVIPNTSAEKVPGSEVLGTTRQVRKTAARFQPLVRAGEHVRLVVTGPGIRMKIPAVCLEPGTLGQTIRARSVEDSQVFHAQVAGAGLLTMLF